MTPQQARRQASEIVRAEARAVKTGWLAEQRTAGRSIGSLRAELRRSEPAAKIIRARAARVIAELLVEIETAENERDFNLALQRARPSGALARPAAWQWLC